MNESFAERGSAQDERVRESRSQRIPSMEERIGVSAFPGDHDQILKSIQTDFHFELMRHLAGQARERFLAAADYCQASGEFIDRLRALEYVPPLALRETYAFIAAVYRHEHRTAAQMELGENAQEHWEFVKTGWVCFFENETERLLESGRMARAILDGMSRGMYRKWDRGQGKSFSTIFQRDTKLF